MFLNDIDKKRIEGGEMLVRDLNFYVNKLENVFLLVSWLLDVFSSSSEDEQTKKTSLLTCI